MGQKKLSQLNQKRQKNQHQVATMLRIAIEKLNGETVYILSENAKLQTMSVCIIIIFLIIFLDIAVKKKKFVPGIGSYKEVDKGY